MTDFTQTLTRDQLNNLNSRLKVYEDSTTNQLVGLLIFTLEDYPIEYYSIEVAEKNKIGTKENSNGLLLLIVKNDRKLRIEVGYGLEGIFPDALVSSIIRNVIVPHFKKNDYYAGINEGFSAIIKSIAGEYSANGDEGDDNFLPGIFPLLMIIFFIISFFIRGGGRRGGLTYYGGGFGGRGWSSRSGGGFSGGFRGGGGSFGGGGASGRW